MHRTLLQFVFRVVEKDCSRLLRNVWTWSALHGATLHNTLFKETVSHTDNDLDFSDSDRDKNECRADQNEVRVQTNAKEGKLQEKCHLVLRCEAVLSSMENF